MNDLINFSFPVWDLRSLSQCHRFQQNQMSILHICVCCTKVYTEVTLKNFSQLRILQMEEKLKERRPANMVKRDRVE